jgi:Bifunctional DNA primase/polymerase, N-terminal
MMPPKEVGPGPLTEAEHPTETVVHGDSESSGYAAGYRIYRDLGWRGPIPVHPTDKGRVPKGFTGHDGVDVTPENMEWFAKSKPGHNIGLRLPADIIGIDVDAYDDKTGAQTLAEAKRRWGALPPTYCSTSRGDGISGIRLYRVPEGTVLKGVIEFPKLGIGDIQIVQRHHRHVQCWPSVHHKTGQTYRWIDELDGSVTDTPPAPTDIPALPARWVEGLRSKAGSNETALDGAQVPVDVATVLTEGQMSQRVTARLTQAINDCYGPSRYDHTLKSVLALLRFGKQGDTGVQPALATLRTVYVDAVGPDRPDGHRGAAAEFDRMEFGDRVGALLAEPDYVDGFDGAGQIGNPPGEPLGPLHGSSDDDGGDMVVERSWRKVDLDPVLSGDWTPPKPTVGGRSDGVGMFYPAKVHSVSSESEGLKTWLLLAAATEEIRAGNHVLFIDFEDDEGGVVGRELALQLSADAIRKQFHYVRPLEPLTSPVSVADLNDILRTYRPTLAIVDGITEGMTMHGLNPLDNQDIAKFGRILPRRLARAGCATVCLDHVVKDAESRGRYALGGVHKLNAIDGAAFLLEGAPFGIGLTGRSSILIAKDRPGQLRRHGRKRKDKLSEFGELVLTSHDESYVEFEIRPPGAAGEGEFRPTVLMGKICAALTEHGEIPQRQILATVGGKRQ